MENNISSNAQVRQLKCSNCGSSSFYQKEDDSYVCKYCESIIQIKDSFKDKFASFQKITSKNANIRIVKPKKTKNEFFKEALIKVGMSPDAPQDIMKATFEKPVEEYGFFVVFETDLTTITLSDKIGHELLQNNEQYSETSSYISCVKVPCGDRDFAASFLNRVDSYEPSLQSTIATKEDIEKYGITIPNKQAIKDAVEDEILKLKEDVRRKEGLSSKVKLIHNIIKSDLYIIPIYSMTFEYNNQRYKLTSLSTEDEILGSIPKAKTSLHSTLKQKETKLSLIPIIFSLASVIFFLLQSSNFRHQSFVLLDIIIIFINVILYFAALLIRKSMFVRSKAKYFEQRKQELLKYFQNNKVPQLTGKDDQTINKQLGWY